MPVHLHSNGVCHAYSSIDGDLERHIDDLIWTRRSEKSIDPREVAKVIVQNRDEEMCTRKIGKEFDQYELPSISDHSSAVYIYRINNTEGVKPNYPASKIFINSARLMAAAGR